MCKVHRGSSPICPLTNILNDNEYLGLSFLFSATSCTSVDGNSSKLLANGFITCLVELHIFSNLTDGTMVGGLTRNLIGVSVASG